MKIGDLLLSDGVISNEQLQEALHKQQESAIVYNEPEMLGKVLIKLNYIDAAKLTNALNKQSERS